MYAALLVLGIKEIEQENQALTAEANTSENSFSEDGDCSQYMGWIIDDFPGTIEQVSRLMIVNIVGRRLCWGPH